MKPLHLRTQIFLSFFVIILIFALAMSFLGIKIINDDIIARAQRQIKHDIEVARVVFNGEIDAIKNAFNLIPVDADLAEVKDKLGLDYLYRVSKEERAALRARSFSRPSRGNRWAGSALWRRKNWSG